MRGTLIVVVVVVVGVGVVVVVVVVVVGVGGEQDIVVTLILLRREIIRIQEIAVRCQRLISGSC